jgi:hypothetical protein
MPLIRIDILKYFYEFVLPFSCLSVEFWYMDGHDLNDSMMMFSYNCKDVKLVTKKKRRWIVLKLSEDSKIKSYCICQGNLCSVFCSHYDNIRSVLIC